MHARPASPWSMAPADYSDFRADPALPAGALQVQAPPPHWGGTRCKGVLLRQAEGHPQVRIFASPVPRAAVLGTVPSPSHAVELGVNEHFVQVQVGTMMGWVGAKNVVRTPAVSPTAWQPEAQPWAPALPLNPVVAQPPSPHSGAKPPLPLKVPAASPPGMLSAAVSTSSAGSAGFSPSWHQASAKSASLPSYTSPAAGRLQGPDYDWIRKANGPGERQMRRSAAEETIAACDAGGYLLDGRQFDLVAVAALRAHTRLVRGPHAMQMGAPKARLQRHAPGLLLDVACELTSWGRKVAVVNAASAYHAGGGFLTGGRHALEESLCMRSTLFVSLQTASALARAEKVAAPKHCNPPVTPQNTPRPQPWLCHIPEEGCLVSPEVEVFRGGSDVGYPFLPKVSKVTVISMAMPNRNKQVRDAPIDSPADPGSYRALVLQKFAAVLAAAGSALGPDGALVIPDVGCGAYGNDPGEVGTLLGEALKRQPGLFSEIHLVGQGSFADAVVNVSNGLC